MNTTTTTGEMRALVLAEYGRMSVEERPIPSPRPGEALLRVIATGICGSDLHGYTGDNGRRHIGQIMGHETVATVVGYGDESEGRPSAGSLVTINPNVSCGWCPACVVGDTHVCPERRVIGVDPAFSSAFAEYLVVPAGNVVALGPDASVEIGALVEPLAVGYHAATRGGVGEGDRVLVIGAGPIGQAVVLAALRLGAAQVIVSEPDPDRRAIASSLGATTIDVGDVHAAVGELTAGTGVDVAIDAVGATPTLAASIAATRRGGTVVLVGMNAPRVELDAYAISTDERTLVGAFCYSDPEFRSTASWAVEHPDLFSTLVSEVVDIDEGPAAFARLATGTTGASKILIRFTPDA